MLRDDGTLNGTYHCLNSVLPSRKCSILTTVKNMEPSCVSRMAEDVVIILR